MSVPGFDTTGVKFLSIALTQATDATISCSVTLDPGASGIERVLATRTGDLLLQVTDEARSVSIRTASRGPFFKFVPEKVESGNESIRRVKAELYCEETKFEIKSRFD